MAAKTAMAAGAARVAEAQAATTAAAPMLDRGAMAPDSAGHLAIERALGVDGTTAFQPPQEWNRRAPAVDRLTLESEPLESLLPPVEAYDMARQPNAGALLAMNRELPLSRRRSAPERPWQWPLVLVLLAASVMTAVYVAIAPSGDDPVVATEANSADESTVTPSVPAPAVVPAPDAPAAPAAAQAAVVDRPVGTSAKADAIADAGRARRATAAAPSAAAAVASGTTARPLPAAVPASASAATSALPVDAGCLDPSAFARILICESASSRGTNTTVISLPSRSGPTGAVGTSGDAAPARDGASALSSAVPPGIAAIPETRDAELVTFVRPEYPEAAKQAALTGAIEMDVTIDASGRVAVASSLSGPMLLRDAAEAAVLQWRFRPAYASGRAVMSRRRFLISFTAVAGTTGGPATR